MRSLVFVIGCMIVPFLFLFTHIISVYTGLMAMAIAFPVGVARVAGQLPATLTAAASFCVV